MLVANSFDLWKKDTFFSAAEEVQESADIMESAYRKWVRERKQGLTSDDLDELCQELQTALGTAKWQLEEFERAVNMSYGHHCDDNRTTRHRQFVAAIAEQISRVETELRESLSERGKHSIQWVNLDDDECDDLAMFLSGTSRTFQTEKDECLELRPCTESSKRENHDASHAIEIAEEGILGTRDDVICQTDRTTGTRRTWSSPNFASLKILVPGDDDEQKENLLPISEVMTKEKGNKYLLRKQRCGEYTQAKPAAHLLNQLYSRVGVFQRRLQSPRPLQIRCSVKFTLALMLTFFLIVPFVFYST